jgi:hypothetical protein
MQDHRPTISRRDLGRMLVALPLASALAPEETAKESPSPQAEFIAAHEEGLSAQEQDRLRKSVTEGEKPLRAIRDFKLPPDVAPAVRFRPVKARRG